jgi:hypothetical protein
LTDEGGGGKQMSKKRKLKKGVMESTGETRSTQVKLQLAPDEVLKEMPAYQQARKLFLVAISGCLFLITISVLLRINVPDLGTVALFFNILAYLLLGAAIFIWLGRIRPLKKSIAASFAKDAAIGDIGQDAVSGAKAKQAASVSTSEVELVEDRPGLFGQLMNSIAGKDPSTNVPKPREYLRYRVIWRLLLLAAGALVLIAWFSVSLYRETPIPLILLFSAYIPLIAAVIIYRQKLRPLKAKWEATNSAHQDE